MKPAQLQLPPLKVGIYEKGKLVRVIELADPRIGFINAWQEVRINRDHVARPLLLPINRCERDPEELTYGVYCAAKEDLIKAETGLDREDADSFAFGMNSHSHHGSMRALVILDVEMEPPTKPVKRKRKGGAS